MVTRPANVYDFMGLRSSARVPASRSLMKSYGLKVPAGFMEQGYSTYWRDDDFDPPYENRQQVWIYSEVV